MTELERACEELAGFAASLRRAGVEVSYPQIEMAAEALISGGSGDREFSRQALRSALTCSPEEGEIFDRVWAGARPGSACPRPPDEIGPRSRSGSRAAGTEGAAATGSAGPDDAASGGEKAGAAHSPRERLRHLDFGLYGPEEERLARTVLRTLAGRLPERVSRRRRISDRQVRLDLGRTLRRSIRTGGDPVDPVWSRPDRRPRTVVFLVDVSGSMQPYAAPMLVLAHAFSQLSREVEVFTFGTRLTHMSRNALTRSSRSAWSEAIGHEVPDWAGGTRIGAALSAYSRGWGRCGMSRGAVIVIFSDGWERGSAGEIETAMGGIHRLARRVFWLNPLAGRPGYEPLAGGMAAALPHVDDFLPAASIADLETFTLELARVRRPAPGSPAARERPRPRSPR